MPLTPATRLGPYEILAPLGAGGMGEVYKARDTRLDRTVAIKILPASLAGDPQFRERFDREARAISQLDHSNICALYDVGEDAGTAFLVMQYLEGETLEQRLSARGALPLADALRIATEIAHALAKAHGAGIVHRDLKPGNVMLTKSGAKLLDFGLAKPGGAGGVSGVSMLPTTPAGITAQGTILGTFQYMSPEQIEGQDADARADIFAFGAVLYEMVAGKKAFAGKSQASLIGAIMHSEPTPMSALQAMSPASLDHLVRRCLAKDRDARWQNARDLAMELEWIASAPAPALAAPAPPAARARSTWLPWALAAVAAVAFVAAAIPLALTLLRRPEPPVPVRFTIDLPADVSLDVNVRPVISPDGRKVAFAGRKGGGNLMAFIRSLDALDPQALPATEGMSLPMFWSPDSKYLGFFADNKVKKIAATGGPAQSLCPIAPTAGVAGASWGAAGVIVFAGGSGEHLSRVSEAGGPPVTVTTVQPPETGHVAPHFLPDGKHFLYLARGATIDANTLFVRSLDQNDAKQLLKGISEARYSAGYLLFARDTTLMAQPFDVDRLAFAGDAIPIAEGIRIIGAGSVAASFSASLSGALAYRTGVGLNDGRQLRLHDRSGKVLAMLDTPGPIDSPAFSPDGQRIAVALGASGASDIWILDRRSGIRQRFTFTGGRFPVWSADGSRIAFSTVPATAVHARPSNGVGDDSVLANVPAMPDQFSPDGASLVATLIATSRSEAIPLSGAAKPLPLARDAPATAAIGATIEGLAQVSPSGKWYAYTSNESGRSEIYVQSFPPGRGKWQISRNGGSEARWRRDGKELFFLQADGKLVAVPVKSDAAFEAGTPVELFATRYINYGVTRNHYDVTADGQLFVVNAATAETAQAAMTVILNWPSELKK